MTANRITGIKEVISILHKCKHEIWYINIHLLNKSYTKEITVNQMSFELPSTQIVSHFNEKFSKINFVTI